LWQCMQMLFCYSGVRMVLPQIMAKYFLPLAKKVRAFADSPWAATVATTQAAEEGTPYDLILIGSSMEGVEGRGTSLSEHVDATEIARLLASFVPEARAVSGPLGLAG
jgi:hypothetical protein